MLGLPHEDYNNCDVDAGDSTRITLRDRFAMAALTGLIANGNHSRTEAPVRAFEIADAMLEARKR